MNSKTKPVYFLDACAMLALIKQEEGCTMVADLYKEADKGKIQVCMNMINLLEVYYGLVGEFGTPYAKENLSKITQSVVQITHLTIPVLMEAGRFKTSYRLSLADAVVLAEASLTCGTIVTADHHEMDEVALAETHIQFKWIR